MSSQGLEGKKYISLATYRRNGDKVPTPVWFILRDNHVFVRTDPISGKVKRIREDPKVAVAPCNMRGEPLGPYVEGVATLSEDDPSEELRKAFRSKYGLTLALSSLWSRLRKAKEISISISLSN